MLITSTGTEIFGIWVEGNYQQLSYNLDLHENEPVKSPDDEVNTNKEIEVTEEPQQDNN